VLQTKRPLRSTQASGQPLKVTTGYLVFSLLHIPLSARGVPLGVLSVDNRTTHRSFSAADEAKLLSLADYASVALENASLYEKAQQEIAERHRAENALRQSQERYTLAVEGAKDGIWDWDMKTQQIYYSSRWKKMLGYQDDEISPSVNEWFNRVYVEDRSPSVKRAGAHRGDTSHFEHEHRLRHKDGRYRWYQVRAWFTMMNSRSPYAWQAL
jgi:PAS domain S-box-containing protein